MIHNQADAVLHPNFLQSQAPFYPVFVPIGDNALLRQGSVLQAEGHQESAEKLFQRAARLHPDDAEAHVAAAVGLFDEDNLTPAFSHLGPLTARFPKSQIVRYYLGLLLGWTGQGEAAIKQFEDTVRLGPDTQVGKVAKKALEAIAAAGSAPSAK